MSNTETKIPDLSIMATIDRAELVAIVKSLGFDPDNVSSIYMEANEIIVHEREGIRSIAVIEEFAE